MRKAEESSLERRLASRIDSLFASLDRPDHPGAAVAIIRGGTVAHLRCFGAANVEDKVPVTEDTVFRIGSVTKQMCATGILILENRKLLSLDDQIGRYLPELPSAVREITLRQLLTMTSGLPDGLVLPIFAGMGPHSDITRNQHLSIAMNLAELQYEPGTQVLYSNTNYLLLSLVIERLSGRTLAQFFASELFEPLGMMSARLTQNPLEIVAHKAKGYVPSRTGSGMSAGLFLYQASGDGGVDASIMDMIGWLKNYRSDRVFGPDYRRRMEAEVRFANGRISPYRLGMTVTEHDGLVRVGHTGGMPGYLADVCFYPEPDIGIVVLTNWMDPDLLEASDAIIEILRPRAKAQSAASRLATGLYVCSSEGFALHIDATGPKIICYMMGDRSPLYEAGSNVFRPTKRGVDFEISPGKDDMELLVTFGGNRPLSFRLWTGYEEAVPHSDYEGRYRNSVIGETHVVRSGKDGKMEIALDSTLRSMSWHDLVPIAHDRFCARIPSEPSLSNLVVEFGRDRQGGIKGLHYRTFRCRDLYFEKTS